MITILSPTKTLDFSTQKITKKYSMPVFKNEAIELAGICKKLTKDDLKSLMNISQNLADNCYNYFNNWEYTSNEEITKQCILAYKGEVFNGLDANSLNEDNLVFSQSHLRILSGLYGVLKPLDKVMPYRLEMQTKLKSSKTNNLYKFWDNKLFEEINKELDKQESKVLINLASNEYYKSILPKKIKHKIITPVFKELKGDQYKVITIYAKKARGLMARYIIENEINTPEELKLFDKEGYMINVNMSTETEWVFTR